MGSVASLQDYIQSPSGTPQALSLASMTPQQRLNQTTPALQTDAATALSRGKQDWAQRTLPQMASAAAAQGNFGSTGANTQAKWAEENYGRQQKDIAAMLARNMANIAQQKVLATMAPMLGKGS